ncbi:hypothetical protein CERSUDRAFT_78145 [Gelatoporia subvermispora B]|uniref:F-box domain-containing protein n=1 Tax=Ceriporiopsis subvermispora (strain B) TaxID=914234 RepID=M2Q414_CERS8|nr:hypothetical protein CERSUDRAFT_78145 [Gelatoporia subvermispora B]
MDAYALTEGPEYNALGPPLDLRNAMPCGPLPQELYDIVIDQVASSQPTDAAGTKDTLLACMLACKQLAESSRKHLYQDVKLSYSSKLPRINILYHPSRLGKYVRRLRIRDDSRIREPEWIGRLDDDSELEVIDGHFLTTFLPMLSLLTNINYLAIQDPKWRRFGVQTRTFLVQHFSPTITKLHLRNINFWNSNQAVRLLQSFPHLSDMSVLGGVAWGYLDHTRSQLSSPVPLSLGTLRISDDAFCTISAYSVHLVNWLVAERPLVRARKLYICWSQPNTRVLVGLMRKLWDNLGELHLCLSVQEEKFMVPNKNAGFYALEDDEVSDAGLDDIIDPESCKQWKMQLAADTSIYDSGLEAWQSLNAQLARLCIAQAPKLKHVTIEFRVPLDLSEIQTLCGWITSTARSDLRLDVTMNMEKYGSENDNLDLIDETLTVYLKTWGSIFSGTSFKVLWPYNVWDSSVSRHSEDFPWFNWAKNGWPMLRGLGLPFKGHTVNAELPRSEDDYPIQWTIGETNLVRANIARFLAEVGITLEPPPP